MNSLIIWHSITHWHSHSSWNWIISQNLSEPQALNWSIFLWVCLFPSGNNTVMEANKLWNWSWSTDQLQTFCAACCSLYSQLLGSGHLCDLAASPGASLTVSARECALTKVDNFPMIRLRSLEMLGLLISGSIRHRRPAEDLGLRQNPVPCFLHFVLGIGAWVVPRCDNTSGVVQCVVGDCVGM